MKLCLMCSCLVMALAVTTPFASADDKPAGDDKTATSEKPKMPDLIYVRMSTSLGDFVIELNRAKAPVTVDNFLSYADEKFYEGVMFHRIIKDFMIQGGGMTPDYTQKPTKPQIKNEADNGLKNEKYTIAMARTSDPHSASSQFFINHADNQFLNHRAPSGAAWGYCVFGKVIGGKDVVEKIANTEVKMDPRADGQKPAAAVTPVIIKKVERVEPAAIRSLIEAARTEEAESKKKEEMAQMEDWNKALELVKSKGGDPTKGAKTASGLWVCHVTEGTGGSPAPTDKVKVHYTGWLTNGTKFDSSKDRGQPITFPLNGVIRGWTEGVGMMKSGGRTFLVIPPDLGYGARGAPGAIPPNATLVFEVELLGINE